MGWKKISANYISDKGLISKICKDLLQINKKKDGHLNRKMSKRPKEVVYKRGNPNG